MSWTQTIKMGELEVVKTVYTPWLGSVEEILREAGLEWVMKRLLVRDIDVDFEKGTTRLWFKVLLDEPGASVFDITITLVRNKDEESETVG
jgi:hypothetical protein